MAGSKSRSGQRPKKRGFTGNQYKSKAVVSMNNPFADQIATSANNSNDDSNVSISSTAKKLRLHSPTRKEKINTQVDESFHGYRLFDIEILFRQLENCLSCKICGSDVKFSESVSYGLATKVAVNCESCGTVDAFQNSKLIGEKKNVPEVNRRGAYAMRCIGQGHAGLKVFCGIMDMPPPVTEKAYAATLKRIRTAGKTAAEKSMSKAVQEEKNLSTLTGGVCVSGDGTWKTRGHTSLIGACTLVGVETGKVLDVEVLSSYCKGCNGANKKWKGKINDPDFLQWKKDHEKKCTKNHSGSAAKMEVDGMVKLFRRSESSRKVKYLQYIGDGDAKTFPEIKRSQPYGADVIEKRECVGHVKKRMGTRLRKLKANGRGKKLHDGKSIGGKGRLTDAVINKLSAYYGNAIRENKNSVSEMRKAVWAIYYHTRSSDSEPLHTFCPKGTTSWCRYQKAVADGKVGNFTHKDPIPSAVMDEMKSIFRDLASPELLKRCVGGYTQNPNESLNSLIWKFCPKVSGAGLCVAEIAAHEAVVCYNDGSQGRLTVMKMLGLTVGNNAARAARELDERRLRQANETALGMTKLARKVKRLSELASAKSQLQDEGLLYCAGNF